MFVETREFVSAQLPPPISEEMEFVQITYWWLGVPRVARMFHTWSIYNSLPATSRKRTSLEEFTLSVRQSALETSHSTPD